MPLFQRSVLKKYLSDINKAQLQTSWQLFQQHFFNSAIQQNIRDSKEEEYQEGFVRDLFVNVLGYTLNPQPYYNFVLEKKTVTDATKSDGAILLNDEVIGVVELKDTGTPDLDKVSNQAFGYKHKHKNCIYVITSNFEKLRFYIGDSTDYEEFNLFTLTQEKFAVLWLCLQKQNLLSNVPLQIKQQSLVKEQNVTKELYAHYSLFKRKLFQNIAEQNTQHDKLLLFKKTQKLLDRFLFIFFAEDRLLLPPNSVREILQQWEDLKSKYDEYFPLYDRFKKYFGYLNVGHVGKQHEIFAYNGGLFLPDDILDNIFIDDTILYEGTKTLSDYDFETDVDVNILGHIFEHSLTEIEELQLELEGKAIEKNKTKRKKEGVFYTPRYITKYIVENTVGALCLQKKEELQINEETFAPKKRKDQKKLLLQKIEAYRTWLLKLTICDPACGSGAFLNAALEYLIAEHRTADELTTRIFGDAIVYTDIENSILENNLYGVDINEDAIEIAKLSLWLRTAKKGRKLSNLSNNIKCGNSLIDDASVAGDKAFKWKEEFKNLSDNGGFDVVIGNPPYVFAREKVSEEHKVFYSKTYYSAQYQVNTYLLFIERSIHLLKEKGAFGLIVPNAWLMVSSAKNLREFVLKNTSVKEIINLSGYSFENVNVETIILIGVKPNSLHSEIVIKNNHGQDFLISNTKPQKDFLDEEDFGLKVFSDEVSNDITIKIKINSEPLDSIASVKAGLQAYEVGKGIPKQTSEDVKNRPYDYNYQFDEKTFKYLDGQNIFRYGKSWSGAWLKYGENLAAPRTFDIFSGEKIIVREITGTYPKSLIATYSDELFLFNRSNIAIVKKDGSEFSLKYILSILNSRLMSYYFLKNTPKAVRQMFPKVILQDLRKFPIKNLNQDQQQLFISKADVMLGKNKELNQSLQQFTQLLQSKFSSVNINNKLQNWVNLTSTEFFKELEKQKIKLPLSEQQEWLQYFKEQRIKANNIQQVIQQTDKEIDKMVYELYGLSEEEIGIVERK